MKRWLLSFILVALVIALFLSQSPWPEKPFKEELAVRPFMAISTSGISAELHAGGELIPVQGRLSISLSASVKEIKNGTVRVSGSNLVMFSVPQGLISGAPETESSGGFLGFSAGSNETLLSYEPGSKTLKGQIEGFVDSVYLAKLSSTRK